MASLHCLCKASDLREIGDIDRWRFFRHVLPSLVRIAWYYIMVLQLLGRWSDFSFATCRKTTEYRLVAMEATIGA